MHPRLQHRSILNVTVSLKYTNSSLSIIWIRVDVLLGIFRKLKKEETHPFTIAVLALRLRIVQIHTVQSTHRQCEYELAEAVDGIGNRASSELNRIFETHLCAEVGKRERFGVL